MFSVGAADGELYMGRGERMSLVLRNQQQVEAALVDYHNELNHLNINKCLRLLRERSSHVPFLFNHAAKSPLTHRNPNTDL